MTMREENTKSPSQKNKQTKSWFWPAVYSGIAIVFVGMIWGYSAFIKDDTPAVTDSASIDQQENEDLIVETNAPKESLKYPFPEALLESVNVLQPFYDMEADAEMREDALLVFDQTYVTNSGVSISVDGEPFEVVAARSGVVEDVITDVFQGDEIVLSHADGMQTIYSSVTGIQVKVGDEVTQGDILATATQNEWNPEAGIHLHFEVLVDGEAVNPSSYLGF